MNAAEKTVSQRLSDYVAGYSYEQIPVAVRERAKLLMLDAIGIAYASTQYSFTHHILSGIRSKSRSDDELMLEATRLFDFLYSAYHSEEKQP